MTQSSMQFQDTAATLLPIESLLSVVALAHPSSQVPATCRLITTAFRSGDPTLVRSWHHHIIFFKTPRQGFFEVAEEKLNHDNPEAEQISSRLAHFLKSRLPISFDTRLDDSEFGLEPSLRHGKSTHPHADTVAPDIPLQDPYINTALVDYLFGSPGPFARQPPLVSRQIQQQLQYFWSTAVRPDSDSFDSDDDEQDEPQVEETPTFLPHRSWQVYPDAIQLAFFFIRAGDPDLFLHTITHLHALQPSLGSTIAPTGHWAALALDNRNTVRDLFHQLSNGNATARFPIFLAILCLCDLSLACLEAVMLVYDLEPSDIVTWVMRWGHRRILRTMLCSVADLTRADRVLPLLHWLKRTGVQLDSVFPLAVHGRSWPKFVSLFNEFDRPMLEQMQDTGAMDYLGTAIVDMARILRISGDSAGWRAVDDVVRFAFKHGLFNTEAKAVFYKVATMTMDRGQAREWCELVVRHTEQDEWVHILDHVVCNTHAPSLETTPDTTSKDRSSHIYNLPALIRLSPKFAADHGVTPIAYYRTYGGDWDWHCAEQFFDAHPTLGAADFVACASQVSRWLNKSDSASPRAVDYLRVEMLSHLLERAVDIGRIQAHEHLSCLPSKELAIMVIACARHLGGAAERVAGADEADGGGEVREQAVPSKVVQSAILDAWKSARDHSVDGCAFDQIRWVTYLPDWLRTWTQDLACRVVADALAANRKHIGLVPPPVVCRIAWGETDLGRALAFVIQFDAGFVAEHMVWIKDTPIWLWHVFTPDLVARKFRYRDLCSCLEQVGRVGTLEDVRALIRRVPDEWWEQAQVVLKRAKHGGPGTQWRMSVNLRQALATEMPEYWSALDG